MRKVLISLALLALAPLHANAYVVNTSVGSYDVTSSYLSGSSSILRTQAWYGSSSLAAEFAAATGNALGTPNGNAAPYFVYDYEFDTTSCGWFGCYPVDGDISYRAYAYNWWTGFTVTAWPMRKPPRKRGGRVG